MASIMFGGQEHELGEFRFREIRAMAPHVDRVLAERRRVMREIRENSTVEQAAAQLVESEGMLVLMTDSLHDLLSVIAIGILKAREEFPYTAAKIEAVTEEIEAEASMDEMNAMNAAFDDIMRGAGLVRKAPLPMAEETDSASSSASTGSSPSLLQPDVPEETGIE